MAKNFDLKALSLAIDDERVSRGLTWNGVAKEIEERFVKMSPFTIKGVGDRPRVEGDGVLQILLWLGRAPESFLPDYSGALVPLSPPEPGKVLRWDTEAIFRALDRKRDRGDLTWNAIAEEIDGVTPLQLKGMAKGGRAFLPEVMRVVGWLGICASHLTKESAS